MSQGPVKWQLNTVYAPGSATTGETFLWHNVDDRLQVGVALLWKQGAFRGLANYKLIQAKNGGWGLRAGFGLQGISTGNPGFYVISEKSAHTDDVEYAAYLGLGLRTNENHGHALGGFKVSPAKSNWTLGVQIDGHQTSPFATARLGKGVSAGYYWIDTKASGYMIGFAW